MRYGAQTRFHPKSCGARAARTRRRFRYTRGIIYSRVSGRRITPSNQRTQLTTVTPAKYLPRYNNSKIRIYVPYDELNFVKINNKMLGTLRSFVRSFVFLIHLFLASVVARERRGTWTSRIESTRVSPQRKRSG